MYSKESSKSESLRPLSLNEWLLKNIGKSQYRTQGQLRSALRRDGIRVDQSSISRGLQELEIRKIGGVYVAPLETSQVNALIEKIKVGALVKKIDTAGPNLLVIFTEVGAAQVVAAAFDGAKIAGMVGTVAGDDTVFVATKGKAAQGRVISALEKL